MWYPAMDSCTNTSGIWFCTNTSFKTNYHVHDNKNQGQEQNAGSKFFMGFGSGVRLCAGAEFVKLQIAILLHHLVTNYRWTVMKDGKAVRQPGLLFPEGFYVRILNKNSNEIAAEW
ncbi:hypothetical protein HRI_003628200 [Hibiscus trionum]|uniref:Cytochrome P450 n=1 Tax=Hibiscus trionum TaxID=183268 RepID=A0A9W7MGX5_HIBTR|nr:hypothetical protein HRI_003628200 [Hibiscus trionum]